MKNPSPKKPAAKKKTPKLPYQEPHLGSAARGKLLEEAIGREVRGFREKLGITIEKQTRFPSLSSMYFMYSGLIKPMYFFLKYSF